MIGTRNIRIYNKIKKEDKVGQTRSSFIAKTARMKK